MEVVWDAEESGELEDDDGDGSGVNDDDEDAGVLNSPHGLALSRSECELLVADRDNHRVAVFDAVSGAFLRAWGSGSGSGSGPGQFSRPDGIGLSPDGRLACVSEGGNHRVQLFNVE